MNLKKTALKLVLILMLLTVLVAAAYSSHGAHVDEHWWMIMPPDQLVEAAQNHFIDAIEIRSPEVLEKFILEGWTIVSTTRLGYTFTMENNRVWPFGTENGGPTDPEYWRTVNFRSAIHRLIPKDEIVALYAPLMSAAEWWLPPGQAYWINPECPLPTPDPIGAVVLLDEAGFEQGATPNPDYDPTLPWSAEYMRIDPLSGEDLTFEYYTIGPQEAPIGFAMAQLINDNLHTAGLGSDLVAGTWPGMVFRLINPDLYDYQLMGHMGIVWGSTKPDILYELTYSENLPLWNFAGMNISAIDEAGLRMMSTLDLAECRQAAFDIQDILAQYEPFLPMLLYNTFSAFTCPYDTQPGAIGIVNFEGRGALAQDNVWGKMLGRAGRYDPASGVEVNKWGLDQYIDSLNPLTADTNAAWQVLNTVKDFLFKRNPYTLDYMWWAADAEPVMEEWIGPGRDQIGGNEVYDNAFNGTHYAGVGENTLPQTPQPDPYPGPFNIVPGGDDVVIAVAQVEAEDLALDDQLGMVTTWTLRDDDLDTPVDERMFWHDSDPGPNGVFNTPGFPQYDDGVKYPVTAEDARFFFDLIRFQQNSKYRSTWWFIHCVEVVDPLTFKVLEERRYPFAFEDHNVALLAPEHIWAPWINPVIEFEACECILPDGTETFGNIWTDWERHHTEWLGWDQAYMPCPIHPDHTLTYLIGCGPFHYPLGGWEPGISINVESNTAYSGRHICQGDVDFDQAVGLADLYIIISSFGQYGDPNYQVRADICYPAQKVDLDEVYAVQFTHFGHWWGPGRVPSGHVECPGC